MRGDVLKPPSTMTKKRIFQNWLPLARYLVIMPALLVLLFSLYKDMLIRSNRKQMWRKPLKQNQLSFCIK